MMLGEQILALLLAAAAAPTALAYPAIDPITWMKRAANPGVVISKCTNPGMLALAYDDGPYQYTSTLVDILDKGGAKGTFFWTGTLYGCIYKEAKAVEKAYKSGHQVASHTWYCFISSVLALLHSILSFKKQLVKKKKD